MMDVQTVAAEPRLSPSSLVGRVLEGRFELFDYLGSGDVTHVFRAWDGRLEHVVAVKVLQERHAREEHVAEAFLEAVRRTAGLPRHPHIVQIYDVGRDSDIVYVVTEFVAGSSLRARITRDAPLAVDQTFRLGRQAAQALAFIHQYGLVHGDLEPENILLNDREDVKITDLGYKQAVESGDPGRTHPLVMASPYTYPLLAGPQGDVYALGADLYELLTGVPPPVRDVVGSMNGAARPNVRAVNPDVPPAAADVVQRALAIEPGMGYSGAAEFAVALQHFLVDHRTTAQRTVVPLPEAPPAQQEPVKSKKKGAKKGSKPVLGPAYEQYQVSHGPRGWRPWATLILLATVAIAVVGGWYAYKGIHRLLNGSTNSSPTPVVTTAHRHGRHKAAHARSAGRPGVAAGKQAAGAACAGTGTAPVKLTNMWVENIGPAPGQPVMFDYTVQNPGSTCTQASLGLTATATAGAQITDRARDAVVNVQPGTHIFKRAFAFPASAAGQTFNIAMTVSDRTGRVLLGQMQASGLVHVRPS